MAKSLKVSYLLWCFTGLVGGHHLYLGRDAQAFLWLATLGGGLLGYFVDLCKLPAYVAQANRSPSYMAGFESKRGLRVREWQPICWIGAYAVSLYFEMICVLALNLYWTGPVYGWLLVCAKAISRAVAVCLCFSVGLKCTRFRWCLASSFLGELLLVQLVFLFDGWVDPKPIFLAETRRWVMVVSQIPFVLTSVTAYWKQRYRQDLSNPNRCSRCSFLVFGWIAWSALFYSALHHHLEIPISFEDPTQTRKLGAVVNDILQSDAVETLKRMIAEFATTWKSQGIVVAKQQALVRISRLVETYSGRVLLP